MTILLIHEPESSYRAASKTHVTAHGLADFRRCPTLYRDKRAGIIPDEDRPAFAFGRAAHMLILEGPKRFASAYAVGGPVNPRTGEPYGPTSKAYGEWQAEVRESGREALPADQAEVLRRMAAAVNGHAEARALLMAGEAEGVIRAEYCGLPCQSRLDWVYQGCRILDLKTCDDLGWFDVDAKRYGYMHQMAFYHAVMTRVAGNLAEVTVHMLAVEKKPPYRVGVWDVPPVVLAAATVENEAAMARLKTCLDTDVWPTGYETIRTFDVL